MSIFLHRNEVFSNLSHQTSNLEIELFNIAKFQFWPKPSTNYDSSQFWSSSLYKYHTKINILIVKALFELFISNKSHIYQYKLQNSTETSSARTEDVIYHDFLLEFMFSWFRRELMARRFWVQVFFNRFWFRFSCTFATVTCRLFRPSSLVSHFSHPA